jgi:4-diphosphocytidyl-2-C-methyl-D-erythritol kinase
MRLRAPAKLNWTLDVLGRREDGYHEVRTVLQTIDLCDGLEFQQADELRLEVQGAHEVSEDDLVLRAARLLDGGSGRGAHIRLAKRIPVASGLGGGSSDAAAALRGLNRIWGLGLDVGTVAAMAAELGSDVSFFLRGGCGVAEGRGERVTPLPAWPTNWLVLLAPPLTLPDKTATMYGALTADDFTDGSRTNACVAAVLEGRPLHDEDLYNAFERVAYERFEGLEAYREALLSAGARAVHLAGAGPALFTLAAGEASARGMLGRLHPGLSGQAFVARTLGSAEALAEEA